jgi:hypothetical protein
MPERSDASFDHPSAISEQRWLLGQIVPSSTRIEADERTGGKYVMSRKQEKPVFSGTSSVFNSPKERLDIKSCGPDTPMLVSSLAEQSA